MQATLALNITARW